MCLMLDQFLWGHSSRVCDISCLNTINRNRVLNFSNIINDTFECKIVIFSHSLALTFVLGAQKNHLIDMVLLSTHNICFG